LSTPTHPRLPLHQTETTHVAARRAGTLGAERAPDVAAVDRLDEDRRLPERKRFEPVQRLDIAAAAADVPLDELRSRREAGRRGHRGGPERVRLAPRLRVRREQVTDVRPGV